MKDIITMNVNLYHVISEPGDMTRYDYFVFKDYDYYCFMPCKNTFRFPQRLNYWDIKDMRMEQDNKEFMKLAKIENCNPHTLKECIKTIIALQKKINDVSPLKLKH